jgi:hypothetical protein
MFQTKGVTMFPRIAMVLLKRRISRYRRDWVSICAPKFYRQCRTITLASNRDTHNHGINEVRLPTESELEALISSLEDINTSFNPSVYEDCGLQGNTFSLHRIMSLCSQLSTVRGAELAERVLWLAIGDDSDSSKNNIDGERSLSRGLNPLTPDANLDGKVNQKTILPTPTREMYTMAIQAWAAVATHYGRQSSKQPKYDRINPDVRISNVNTNIASEAANRALQILDFMWEEYHRRSQQKNIFGDPNVRYQRYMQRLSTNDDPFNRRRPVPPDTVHYTAVMDAIAGDIKSGDAPYQVDRLMKQMEELSGIDEMRSKIESSETCNKPLHLEQWLHLDRDLIPDRVCYHSLLNAWCRNRVVPIREKVKAMRQYIKKMETWAMVLQDEKLKPNTKTYNLLIMAYGVHSLEQDLTLQHGQEAENILKEMISLHVAKKSKGGLGDDADDDNGDSTLPNIKSYNGVINAWAMDSTKIGSVGPLRAERILMALIQNLTTPTPSRGDLDIPITTSVVPDIATFNSVITTWAKSNMHDAGYRAEKLLRYLHGTPVPLTDKSFLQNKLENDITKSIVLNIQPDAITFNAVVNAWCQSEGSEAANKAFDLLSFMIKEYTSGNDRYKPTVTSISATINKLGHSDEVGQGDKAYYLLTALLRLQKNDKDHFPLSRQCFSRFIEICSSKASIKKVGDKALFALHHLQEHFSPTIDEYNNTLAALTIDIDSNADEAHITVMKAQTLLLDIMNNFERDKLNAAPNIHTFHHALRACNHPNVNNGKVPAHIIAMTTFRHLERLHYCRPDSQTFVLMFKIVGHRAKALRHQDDFVQLCDQLFESCCDEGLLTNSVLKIIYNNLPVLASRLNEQFRKGADNSTLSVTDLPSDWSSHRRKGQNQKRNRNKRR